MTSITKILGLLGFAMLIIILFYLILRVSGIIHSIELEQIILGIEMVAKFFLLQFYLFGYDFVRLGKKVFAVVLLRLKPFCLPSLSRQKI